MDEKLEYIKSELQTLGTAFGETRKARMDAIRFYFMMLGAVPVVLGLVLNGPILDVAKTNGFDLPLVLYAGCIAFVIATIGGTLVMLQVHGLRLEEILYARAINALRFYVDKAFPPRAGELSLATAFALPSSDKSPPFVESLFRPARMILWMMIFVNVLLMYGAFVALQAASLHGQTLTLAVFNIRYEWVVVIAYLILQWGLITGVPIYRERTWRSVTGDEGQMENW